MTLSRSIFTHFGGSLVLLLFPLVLAGQFAQRIRTARPSVTMGTYTIGQNVLQWQAGMRWQEVYKDQVDHEILQYRNVIRWGLLEHWEISGVINYQQDWTGARRSIKEGIHTVRLGIRHHLFEKEGFLKAAAIQGRLWLPFTQNDYGQEQVGGRLMASVSYRLFGKFQLITNGGLRWTGQTSSKAISFFSLRFSHPLDRNLVLVVDYFSDFNTYEPDYAIGIGYFVGPAWKLDIAIGNLGDSLKSHRYLEVGWATRINWRS